MWRRGAIASPNVGSGRLPAVSLASSLHRWLCLPPGVRTATLVAAGAGRRGRRDAGRHSRARTGCNPGRVGLCLRAEPDEGRLAQALGIPGRLPDAVDAPSPPII
jgi:hypothetical protein